MSTIPGNQIPRWQEVLINANFSEPELKAAVQEIQIKDIPSSGLSYDYASWFFSEISKIINQSVANFIESLAGIFNLATDSVQNENERVKSIYDKFKINFVTALRDTNRLLRTIADPILINAKNINLGANEDQPFTVGRESLAGKRRMFSDNSDATYCVGLDQRNPANVNKAPVLLAAVADGISGAGLDRELSTGKIAADAVIDHVKNHELEFADFEKLGSKFVKKTKPGLNISTVEELFSNLFDANSYQTLLASNLRQFLKPGIDAKKKLQDLYLEHLGLNLAKDEFSDCSMKLVIKNRDIHNQRRNEFDYSQLGEGTTLTRAGYTPIDLKKLENESLKFYQNKSLDELAKTFLIDDYKPILNAMKVLNDSVDQIKSRCEEIIPETVIKSPTTIKAEPLERNTRIETVGITQTKSQNKEEEFIEANTTVSLAIDLGERLMLISAGDTIASAFNANGIIENSLNSADRIPGEGTVKSYLGVVNRGQGWHKQNPAKFTVCFIDKKNIEGLVLASDGILKSKSGDKLKREEVIPPRFDQLNSVITPVLSAGTNPQKIIQAYLQYSREFNDDKSLIVLSKGSHLAP